MVWMGSKWEMMLIVVGIELKCGCNCECLYRR